MKTEIQEQCTICYNSTNPTVITEEILKLLKLLNTNINIALLQQAIVCESCLVKIKLACKFKTSYLDLQKIYPNIKSEGEGYSHQHVVCEICKNTVNTSDTLPLFDPVAKTNELMLVNYLSHELESESSNDLQICEPCHKSMLIFCNITNLLSTLYQKTCELYLKQNESGCVNMNQEPQPDSHSISANSSEHCSMDIKEELQDINEKLNIEYDKFLVKNEELDLKMDSEEPGDVGTKLQRKAVAENLNLWIQEANKSQDDSDTMTQINLEEIMFQCDFCEFRASQKKILSTHMLTHCNISQHKTRYNRNLKMNKLIHKNPNELKIFQCNVCDYKAKQKGNLKKHMIIHKKPDEIVMFQCEMCDYSTRHKVCIKMHVLSHKDPQEVEMFECEICDYKALRNNNFKVHMLIHKQPHEIEMFQCDVCDYKARQKGNLKKHMLIHKKPDEIEMFQCEMCDYKARQKSSIKRHMLTHKKPDDIEMVQCTLCDYKTIRKDNLRMHILTHKKPDEIEMFPCELCDYKATLKGNLKKHVLTHKKPHEIVMFDCEMCDYKATQKGNLRRHMLTHNKLNKKVVSV